MNRTKWSPKLNPTFFIYLFEKSVKKCRDVYVFSSCSNFFAFMFRFCLSRHMYIPVLFVSSFFYVWYSNFNLFVYNSSSTTTYPILTESFSLSYLFINLNSIIISISQILAFEYQMFFSAVDPLLHQWVIMSVIGTKDLKI